MLPKTDSTVTIKLTRDFPGSPDSGFQAELERVVEEAPQEIWLNCGAVERVTSQGVGVLWRAYQRCAEAGVTLRIASPSRGLTRALAALDLHEFFGLPATPETGNYRPSEPTEPSAGVYSDSFLITETSINEALARFGDHIRTMQLDSDTEFELQTVFYEVSTNVREHGQVKESDIIQVAFVAQQELLTLSFTDPGRPFDPTRHHGQYNFESAATKGQTRGFGIALIERMTDSMSYARPDGSHNMLTLIKRRSVSP